MNIQKKFIEYLKFQNIVITQNTKDKWVLDVDGDIDLSGMGLVKIPIKFLIFIKIEQLILSGNIVHCLR